MPPRFWALLLGQILPADLFHWNCHMPVGVLKSLAGNPAIPAATSPAHRYLLFLPCLCVSPFSCPHTGPHVKLVASSTAEQASSIIGGTTGSPTEVGRRRLAECWRVITCLSVWARSVSLGSDLLHLWTSERALLFGFVQG